MLSQGHGFDHGFSFVDGFLKFGFGDRIVDPAAAGLDVGFAVLEHGGADGDAAVEIAVKTEVADRAAVGAAGGLLKFADDLHGADLRRAGEGAGGKGGAQEIVGGLVRAKLTGDAADDCLLYTSDAADE